MSFLKIAYDAGAQQAYREKKALPVISWGGGGAHLAPDTKDPSSVRPGVRAGYTNVYGALPWPDLAVRVGNRSVGGLSLGTAGIGVDNGLPNGRYRSRGIPAVADKLVDMVSPEHVRALAARAEAVDAAEGDMLQEVEDVYQGGEDLAPYMKAYDIDPNSLEAAAGRKAKGLGLLGGGAGAGAGAGIGALLGKLLGDDNDAMALGALGGGALGALGGGALGYSKGRNLERRDRAFDSLTDKVVGTSYDKTSSARKLLGLGAVGGAGALTGSMASDRDHKLQGALAGGLAGLTGGKLLGALGMRSTAAGRKAIRAVKAHPTSRVDRLKALGPILRDDIPGSLTASALGIGGAFGGSLGAGAIAGHYAGEDTSIKGKIRKLIGEYQP